MKAVAKTRAARGVEIIDIPRPAPGDGEILIEVRAAGICGSDNHVYEWTSSYEWMADRLPVVLGHEFSGVVVGHGRNAGKLPPGSRVVVKPLVPCGECYDCRNGVYPTLCPVGAANSIGLGVNGAFAEYVAVPEANCLILPDNISFAEAALIEPLGVAANSAWLGEVILGDNIALFGPGAIGLLTMLCAIANGAAQVIMIGTSKDKSRLALARELGATHTIEADTEDAVGRVMALTGGHGVRVVYEATSSPKALLQGMEILQRCGTMVVTGIHSEFGSVDTKSLVRQGKTIKGSYGGRVTWERLIAWLSAKNEISSRVPKIITNRIALEDAAEAFERNLACRSVKEVFVFPEKL